MVNKRPGRPARPTDSKDRILRAAQARFAEHGYARTSLRSIARDADVDHALVSYYFGSKEGLFKAIAELSLTPAEVLDVISDRVPRDQLGRALLEAALTTWDRPDYREGLAQLIGDGLASPAAQRVFREYLQTEMVARLAAVIGGANASKHAAALASIIAGIFFTRCILKVEPIASMSRADVIRHHTPAVNAILRPPPPTRAGAPCGTRR